MFDVVLWITRPDGKAPQVGDADDGRLYILSDYHYFDRTDFRYLLSIGAILFHRSDMKSYSREFDEDAFWLLGPTGIEAYITLKEDQRELVSKAFRHAGLYVMRQKDRYLLACCGKVGTDGIGNHKHNDLCSFELYVGDKAFIVDPGSYVYRRSPEWRNRFRSTTYHNTVVIDGQEQNRFNPRHLFRMTNDSAVSIYKWSSTATEDWLDVAHTGYERLNSPVQHRRTFWWDKLDDTWQITDMLTGAGTHMADWYFHFNPGIELVSVDKGVFRTCGAGTNLIFNIQSDISFTTRIEEGWISKRYGHKDLAQLLHIIGSFDTACYMTISISVI
jgi:hypothetical protein